MKTRTITVVLTFLAGLYFILDFVVPPTLPLVSARGVVASRTIPSFSVASGSNRAVTYRMDPGDNRRVQILVEQRDALGAANLVAVPLRKVGLASTVTVRYGPFLVKSLLSGTAPTISTEDGLKLTLQSGQRWVNGTSQAPVATPAPGMTLSIEQPAGRITEIDRGSIDLLVAGRRQRVPIESGVEIVKAGRFDAGSEAQLEDLRVGDTVQVGFATGFADNRDTAAQFNLVLTTMAFGIGLLSLGMVHTQTLAKRRPGWYLSVVFLAAVVVGVLAGIGKYQEPNSQARAFSDFVVLQIISSVTSAVFSILAFYMASAAYRAFRIRSGEAALMMVSALIVMLGQTPFGSYMTGWIGERYSALQLPNIAAWILRVPNTAVFRGLLFGIMLGAIATALRYWLSMERSVTSGD